MLAIIITWCIINIISIPSHSQNPFSSFQARTNEKQPFGTIIFSDEFLHFSDFFAFKTRTYCRILKNVKILPDFSKYCVCFVRKRFKSPYLPAFWDVIRKVSGLSFRKNIWFREETWFGVPGNRQSSSSGTSKARPTPRQGYPVHLSLIHI